MVSGVVIEIFSSPRLNSDCSRSAGLENPKTRQRPLLIDEEKVRDLLREAHRETCSDVESGPVSLVSRKVLRNGLWSLLRRTKNDERLTWATGLSASSMNWSRAS
jgi:hypothetical protein